MSERDRLEAALGAVSADLAFPPTPALSERVATRLTSGERAPRSRRRPLVLVAAALVALALLFSAVMTFSPAARHAVADFLGISGIEIVFGGEPKDLPGTELSLGRSIDLSDAQALVDFPISYPSGLGEPDAVYVDDRTSADPIVNLVYSTRRGLPASGDGDVGLLLTEFRANIDEFFIKKLIETHQLDTATVAGSSGFWLDGGPHVVTFVDRTHIPFEQDSRLVQGNTLIWESDGVSYRMESELSKYASVRLGDELTP